MSFFVKESDAVKAAALAGEGMSKADHADRVQLWKQVADAWLEAVTSGAEITADTVLLAIGAPDVGANRNNVVGAWFSGKAKQGRLVFAGRMRKSTRPERHGNVQRVWIVT